MHGETNLKGKNYSEVHLGSSCWFETYHYQSWKTLSIFWLTVSMRLLIKRSMKLSEILKKPCSFVLEQFISGIGYSTDAPLYAQFSRKRRRQGII